METPEDIWGNLEIPIDPIPDFDPAFQPLQYRVFQLFLFYLENFISWYKVPYKLCNNMIVLD